MPTSKRPRKKHKPRPIKNPVITQSYGVLAPVEQIIEQIEATGMVTCDIRGNAIYSDLNGNWHSTHHSLAGLIEGFELCETRFKVSLPLEPLREFTRGVPYDWPVSESLLSRLKLSLVALRQFLNWANSAEMVDIVKTVQIGQEIRREK